MGFEPTTSRSWVHCLGHLAGQNRHPSSSTVYTDKNHRFISSLANLKIRIQRDQPSPLHSSQDLWHWIYIIRCKSEGQNQGPTSTYCHFNKLTGKNRKGYITNMKRCMVLKMRMVHLYHTAGRFFRHKQVCTGVNTEGEKNYLSSCPTRASIPGSADLNCSDDLPLTREVWKLSAETQHFFAHFFLSSLQAMT